MRHSNRSRIFRTTRLETMEDRLALTAQPWGAAAETASVVSLGELLSPAGDVRVEHHSQPTPDFWLGNLGGDVTGVAAGELQRLANEQHLSSGVQYAYSNFGLTGAGQTVVVIDSGIAYDHVALGGGFGSRSRVVGGWDFAENDADPYDDGPAGFHGTHVAGIIGSTNATYRGVAPGVDLVALRVFDDRGAGYFSWVEDALSWVHQHRNSFANPITTVNLSIGMDWNADTVPYWANLEDEFAQLEADGIFISVSAGNGFGSYRSPGLSYPAASSHVVPVASVDASGLLSGFSQRSSRVIAAPGRNITSTVPDYLYGADGIKNDFGSASGTSMAAPYVAGASTLIRQALEFTGQANVDQGMIYDVMWRTADLVFDSVTNATYRRLNLQTALNAIMPADDYGNTAATAQALGTIQGMRNITGAIGSVSDTDYFTFTAAQTGDIKLTVTSPNGLAPTLQVNGSSATLNQGVATIAAVAGQSYTFAIGSRNGIGHYQVNLEAPTAAPTAPGNFQAVAAGQGAVTLNWSDSSHETEYWVYQWINGRSEYIAGLNANTTSFTVKSLAAGTHHFYVVAHNAVGDVGSGWQSVQLRGVPTAPGSFQVIASGANEATLTWTDSQNEHDYWIYQWKNGRSEYIAGVAANTTSYKVTDLAANQTHFFYVVAHNADGTTGSGWQQVALTAQTAPSAPALSATATAPTSVQLNWSQADGAAEYWVYTWNGRSEYLAGVNANTTSYQITGLTPGQTLHYYVVARNSAGITGSGWKSVTLPLAPSQGDSSNGPTVVGPDGYSIASYATSDHGSRVASYGPVATVTQAHPRTLANVSLASDAAHEARLRFFDTLGRTDATALTCVAPLSASDARPLASGQETARVLRHESAAMREQSAMEWLFETLDQDDLL